MRLSRFFKAAADFMFPQHLVCHACGCEAVVNEYGICGACETKLKRYELVTYPAGLDGYTAGLWYNEASKHAVHEFKFRGSLYQKEFLAHFMEIPEEWRFDYVVPVPLHKRRERKRGYNQSVILAKELCKRYNLVMRADLLTRIKYTKPQTNLGSIERQSNTAGAFLASPECKSRSILLVDDVRTTGATMNACIAALHRVGVERVYGITACCVGNN